MQDSMVKALEWRYATKVFDQNKKITQQDLNTILESGRLAPSSFGIEPWKFIVVENAEMRTKLRAASFDQPKVTEASCIIVIARRTDARENISRELVERIAKSQNQNVADLNGLKQMLDGSISGRSDESLDTWIKAQTYIPFGIMIATAALLNIDNGPMEGFNPTEVDKILGLDKKHLTATTMLALGYRGEDAAAQHPKTRRSFDEVVEFVK